MTKLFQASLEKMASYQLVYNGQKVKVDLIQATQGTPEFFFHVQQAAEEYFLSKRQHIGQMVWLGGGPLPAAKALGDAIETAIGFSLPLKETNNPFQYKGDRTVRIETFQLNGVLIERAKAPFNQDVYYRLTITKGRPILMIKAASHLYGEEGCWYSGDDVHLKEDDFDLFRDLLQNFERAYQVPLYKPIQVIER